MALISGFDEVKSDRQEVHRPVSCGWRAFNTDEKTILQLDTYGSDQRKILNKVSQSIQLDRAAAATLVRLIRDTFPGL